VVSRICDQVAEAVADGRAVDWSEVERRLDSPSDRPLVAGLRTIARLAESTSACRLGASPRPAYATRAALTIVLLLAGVKVTIGLIAAAGGGQEPRGGSLVAVAACFAATGVVLLFGARSDRRAALLGGFMLTVAAAFSHRLVLRLLPPVPGATVAELVWRGLLPETFFTLLLWLFVAEFPRVVRLCRSDTALQWGIRLAAASGSALFVANLAAAARYRHRPGGEAWMEWVTRDGSSGTYWLALFSLALAALITAWRRRRDALPSEQRRVTLFIAALVVGLAPSVGYVLIALLCPPFDRWTADPMVMPWVRRVTHASLMSIPVAAGYAAFARHLFDLRWMIGRAAQYVLLKTTLAVATLVPAIALAIVLYERRSLPLDRVFSGTDASAYAILMLSGTALFAARRFLRRMIDRRFVRQSFDLGEGLARISERLRGASDLDSVASIVVDELTRTLGVEGATLLVHEVEGRALRPVSGGARSLPDGSAITALVACSSDPLVVEPAAARSAFPLLPEPDRHWVLDNAAAVIVGASEGTDRCLSWLLAAGRKRRGTSFTPEELRFVTAIGATAALALENLRLRGGRGPSSTGGGEDRAGLCAECHRALPSSRAQCSCGGEVTEAALPYELNGKFRLTALLGRGGMGVVYEAEDLVLGRRVALKTLPHLSADHSLRLRVEARAMAALTHPNLARIHGAESWRGVPVLVLELLEGDTLARRIARRRLTVEEVTALGLALARGLESMHRRGLLHRDVKPSNVGFDAEGTPKLLDFGLAHLLEATVAPSLAFPLAELVDSTPTGHIMGTPLYLPPEAADGAIPDQGQDLWSTAVVLYECLVGSDVLRGAVDTRPSGHGARWPPVSEHRPECPWELVEFLANALNPDRRRRPASAGEFAARLGATVTPRSELFENR
jgi:hypothetical protein